MNAAPGKRGKFVLTAKLLDPATGSVIETATLDFACVEHIPPPKSPTGFSVCGQDSIQCRYLGVGWKNRCLWRLDGSSIEECFDLKAAAGMTWMRSWDFDWRSIEREQGRFDWRLQDMIVEEASKRGIRLMPVLGSSWQHNEKIPWNPDSLPDWVLKTCPLSPVASPSEARKGYMTCLPSVELWSAYVTACVERYKGRISHWEMLNEPNMFLTAEQYVTYMRATYMAMKKADNDARLVGLCATGDLNGNILAFMRDCFKIGALDCCDLVSFHPYSARLDSSAPFSAEEMTTQVKALMREFGADKELWNTELFYLAPQTVDDNYFQHLIKGHELPRRCLIDLATGVSKSFCIPDDYLLKVTLAPNYWHNSGQMACSPIPSRLFVISNTLAKLFNGARFVKQIPLVGRNRLYLFEKDGSPIAAAWCFDDPGKTSDLKIPATNGRLAVFDMMGNSLETRPNATDLVLELSNSPVYITPGKALSADDFHALIGQAKASGKVPLQLSAHASYRDGKPVIILEAENTTSDLVEALLGVAVPGREFDITQMNHTSVVPAAKAAAFPFPITSTNQWSRAQIIAQAMVGDRVIEKRCEMASRKLAECPASKTPVRLDGLVNQDEWSDASMINIDNAGFIKDGDSARWKGPDDCSATFYLKHDAENLYVAAKVSDDSRGERRAKEWAWDADGVEIFIDTDPDADIAHETYTGHTYQILFGMPTSQYSEPILIRNSVGGKGLDVTMLKCVSSSRNGGYDVEMAIPWKALDGCTPTTGHAIGFDAAIDDGDQGQEGRALQMIWAGDGDNCRNREKFGRMIIK